MPRRTRWSAAATIAALLVLITPAAAQAGTGPVVRTATKCVILLNKVQPGQAFSKEVSRTCGDSREMAATPADGVLLIELYPDANYHGVGSEYRGLQGPCDGAGYKIGSVRIGDSANASSFSTANQCNDTTLYVQQNFRGQGTEWKNTFNVSYIGDELNDNLGSMIVKRF